MSPILGVSGALDGLCKLLEASDAEEFGLVLTTCTNLCAGEVNGSMFFEDGRLFKRVMRVLEETDKENRSANEQQMRDIAMLCLSNFSVNPSNTTRMVEKGALAQIVKSVHLAPRGLERRHAVKALSYVSQDGACHYFFLLSPPTSLKKKGKIKEIEVKITAIFFKIPIFFFFFSFQKLSNPLV